MSSVIPIDKMGQRELPANRVSTLAAGASIMRRKRDCSRPAPNAEVTRARFARPVAASSKIDRPRHIVRARNPPSLSCAQILDSIRSATRYANFPTT